MRHLVDELRTAIPAAFESEDYRNRRQALEDGARERQETAFQALREKAEAQDIALIRTPTGFAFAPIADGAVMEPKAFNAQIGRASCSERVCQYVVHSVGAGEIKKKQQ